MPIGRTRFGRTRDGRTVDIYRLTNRNGLEARVMTYGATLVSLRVPDRAGVLGDVVLGFDSLEPYLGTHPHFGSVIGRCANRIANGAFELDGLSYRLPCNDGPHHLHGGKHGFHAALWTAKAIGSADAPQLALTRVSPNGEERYPGSVEAEVRYTLTASDELRLDYTATTDAPTLVNLTHHAYFNLTTRGTIRHHLLRLNADHFLAVDTTLIPTGERRSIMGTPFDFNTPTQIGARIDERDEQLEIAGGYDHTWILAKRKFDYALEAELYDPYSGRTMSIYTTEPGMHLYTANFLDGTIRGKRGELYGKFGGLCLEAQHFPDTPHHPDFPSIVLRPGDTYRQTTIYRFGVRP